MASRKKVENMSEDREDLENGETVNDLRPFTMSAVNADYDIVIDPTVMSPTFFQNICKMAERTYKHIMSNEALASKGYKDAEGSEVAQNEALKKWRDARRELIVSGELGFREGGPRISPEDKEWVRLIDEELLKPRLLASGIAVFPTSGKTMIRDKTLNEWREYCKASPRYAELKTRAAANVAATRAKAEQAKTSGQDNPFAEL